MNLLDTASLVVTPNGYKASKLYSIIPSDGSGDMTFARTGDTATRVNSSGLIETVLANKPRLDYLGSTCPKLLLEPQRTNSLLQSQDISSASWNKANSPTIVSNVAVAPDGTTTADSIQDTAGINYKFISQTFTVSANSTQTFSVFVKKETTKTNFGGLAFYFLGGTNKIIYVAFDEVLGIGTNLSESSITPIIKVENYGTYWRLIVTVTDTGSNTDLIAYYYPTISNNGTNVGIGAGSARTIWGLQLEAGAYATSYIPTTTASVTRVGDRFSKTSISSLIGQTEGTFFAHLNLLTSNAFGASRLSLSSGFQPDWIFIGNEGNNIRVYLRVNDSVVISYSTVAATGNDKIAIAYKSGNTAIYINGVQLLTNSSTFAFSASLSSLSYSSFIAQAGDDTVKLNSAALWKTRLQNSELATLTSL